MALTGSWGLSETGAPGAWPYSNLQLHKGLGTLFFFFSPPQGLSEVLTHPEGAVTPPCQAQSPRPEARGGRQCLGWLGQRAF